MELHLGRYRLAFFPVLKGFIGNWNAGQENADYVYFSRYSCANYKIIPF